MARTPKIKELENSRLLKEYASWIYCTNCNRTVAYLCYVTYDLFNFDYVCECGCHGSVNIEFEHSKPNISKENLKQIKNRMCCPKDDSPLVTLVDKNINSYKLKIICNNCNTEFMSQGE